MSLMLAVVGAGRLGRLGLIRDFNCRSLMERIVLMFVDMLRLRNLVTAALVVLFSSLCSWSIAMPSGSFVAVLNERNFGSTNDVRRTVQFYDAENVLGGPLFSVFVPFEPSSSPTSSAYDEPNTVTVDPSTGDIYMLAFDNHVNPGEWGVDTNGTAGTTADDDTTGDWDLFRINFQTVLDHWTTNFMGRDIRNDAQSPMVGGPAPVAKAGMTDMQDYVAYGVLTPYAAQVMTNTSHVSPEGAFDQTHSNTFVLGNMTVPGGAIEKVGELNRNRYSGSSNFHTPLVTFVDSDTLLMIDDARQPKTLGHDAANDYDYRIIERVSTSAGAATVSNPDMSATAVDGGFNNTTTESWESRRIAQMMLDTTETEFNSFLSDPQSIAYHNTGSVRGAWVVDRDTDFFSAAYPEPDTSSGDDVAFLQLDSNGDSLGYRQFVGGATKFEMQNDPEGGDTSAGRVGKVFVDPDNGDLIVIEEGFTDSGDLKEPAIIRVSVNYDSGGQIALGAWGEKHVLGDDLEDGLPKDSEDTFMERGYFSAYDSVADKIYFVTPGDANSDPAVNFGSDIYVFDLATNTTSAFLNVGNDYSLFFAGSNMDAADKIVAFTLAADTGLAGDYNGDGYVDAADYTVWRNNLGDLDESNINNNGDGGGVTITDYQWWKDNYGEGTPPGSGSGGLAGAVPEPGSIALLLIGMAGCIVRRRT